MATRTRELQFDFAACFGKGKIAASLWKKNLSKANAALARLARETGEGKLGFWKLPATYGATRGLSHVVAMAEAVRQRFDNLVVIGIGGSSLGGRMLFNALAHRYHNELPREFGGPMRLYFLENNDPDSYAELMDRLDLSRTLFNVVSKSGSTAETACQYVLVRDRLQRELPDGWRSHFLFTTDPKAGLLRDLAHEERIETLEIPSDVGGRYSVLCPVGLFPAQAIGIDAKALLAGAARMAKRCLDPAIDANPALQGALMHVLADRELGRNMVVSMPYADRLRDWTEWFGQLWAESLGKEKTASGETVRAGTTPIKALGAIDQHSQVQLYMEGPNDKVFMFIRNERFEHPTSFPKKGDMPKAFQYFAGHSMEELLLAEQRATRFALGEQGRMTYQVTTPRIDADAVGQLVFWAEAMTVLAGYLYGVDPFDQPGVELGKKFAYGLMGRAGYEEYRQRIEKAEKG
ncbi:MAG: glucose-6-phosphate isomerase [Myxococcales bacterium]|nr:MAG: glucose-6-phosphate isomerase [Myxococcales bacterium]